jgi:hypothetical protein
VDELPLGLAPSTKRKRSEPKPVPGVRWTSYSAKDRRLCDDCMAETPTVGGVPVHVVNRAFYQRKEGTTVGYFCGPHHQHRIREEGS